ncbi:flippase [Salinibacter ruber]|uniref:flippase n=1 Tax=Salinibacter ruber TaxID=146919 RepID=UPI00216A65CD|nr:flippase [Salinibacter ruber]MCS3702310.1 O-antigen/teichoic acid export membrane protein [Salinibacter ruber]
MKIGFKKLGIDISLNVLRHVVKVGLKLGVFVLIARVLGPEGNGKYSISILVPTLLSKFLNFGIPPANVFYVGREDVSVKTAMRTSLTLWTALSIFGISVGGVIISLRGAQWFPSVPYILLWMALLAFPFVLLERLFLGLLQSVQDFKRYNGAMLVAPAMTLGIAAVLVWGFGIGAVGAVAAFGSGYFIGAIVAGLAVRPHLEQHRVEEDWWSYAKNCVGYGWKAHLGNVMSFLNYRADLYLVNFFASPAAAGIYVIAVRIAERLWILSSAVSTVILPRLAEMHTEEEKRKYLTPLISRWVLIASFGACVALAIIAGPLIQFLFGQEYMEAVGALLLLLPGVVVGSFTRILANDIAARGRPELNLYTSILVVVVNIVSNIILIPLMGIKGAAIATTISYSINGVTKIWLHTYLSGNRWWETILVEWEDWRLIRKGWVAITK